jgi:NAD(P)-dependent dehydrogenase (short-subunit alcohol dehydrogenase family)
VISSNEDRVKDAVKRLSSPHVSGHVGDVRDEAGFVEVLKGLAPIDHLVFSGVDIIIRGKLEELDLDHAKHLFGVKFWGAVVIGKGMCIFSLKGQVNQAKFVFLAVKKFDLVAPGGSITLTSGGAAYKPGKGAATGGALNAGVITLTKGLAADLAEKKIRVNVVVPGLVKTELWDKLGKSKEDQQKQFEETKLPVGFVATPDDIAEAYLYLAKADYATGTSVQIGE